MIKKIKDLSKVKLNAQDVMIMSTVKLRKTNLDLSTVANKDDIKDREQFVKMEIIAVGNEVPFKPKDLIDTKEGARLYFETLEEEKLDGGWIQEYRVGVVHMNNIEFAVEPDNINE